MSRDLPADRAAWPPDAVCSYEERAGILQAEGLPRPYAERLAQQETARWWALHQAPRRAGLPAPARADLGEGRLLGLGGAAEGLERAASAPGECVLRVRYEWRLLSPSVARLSGKSRKQGLAARPVAGRRALAGAFVHPAYRTALAFHQQPRHLARLWLGPLCYPCAMLAASSAAPPGRPPRHAPGPEGAGHGVHADLDR